MKTSDLPAHLPLSEYQRAEQIALKMARSWYVKNRNSIPTCLDEEDFLQAARIGLWRAVERYQPHRKNRFSTYGVTCALGCVKRLARDSAECSREDYMNRNYRVPDSLQVPIVGSDGNERLHEDLLADPGPLLEDITLTRVQLQATISQLPCNLRQVIELYYLEQRSQAEIGKIIGFSQMQVSRILRSGIHQLRQGISLDTPEALASLSQSIAELELELPKLKAVKSLLELSRQ